MNKLFFTAAMMLSLGTAQANPTVSFILGADDYADIFISTDDTQQGSLIGSTSFFSGPLQTITSNLTSGITNYIHILVQNYGGPDSIAGEFTLIGSGFEFSNGKQFLSTTPSTVNLSATGFGVDYQVPVSYGAMIDYGTYYSDQFAFPLITENISGVGGPSYFSIPVYAVAAVPEPESGALLLAGLGLLGGALRRRQR